MGLHSEILQLCKKYDVVRLLYCMLFVLVSPVSIV
jgi:hypothetical protein